jgi:hypothetical protein
MKEGGDADGDLKALIALGVIIAIVFLDVMGTTDVHIWVGWQQRALRFGLLDGYHTRWVDYPPLSFTLLWIAGKLSYLAGIPKHLGLKLMLLAFLLVTVALAQAWRRDWWITLALLWLAIPDSVALGYLDILYAPTLLAMVWALQSGRRALAPLLLACSCLMKWQPLILAPFLIVHLWRDGAMSTARQAARLLWPAVGAVLAVVVVFNEGIFGAFGRALTHPYLSANALNFQWILTGAVRIRHPEAFEGLLDGAVWPLTVPSELDRLPWSSVALWSLRAPFFALYFFILAVFARHRRGLAEFLSFSFVGYACYFIMATGVHENHLFPGCLLLLGLGALEPSRMSTYLLWTTIHNLNCFFFYGCSGEEPRWLGDIGGGLSLLLAAFNVLVFVVLLLERVWDEMAGRRVSGQPG